MPGDHRRYRKPDRVLIPQHMAPTIYRPADCFCWLSDDQAVKPATSARLGSIEWTVVLKILVILCSKRASSSWLLFVKSWLFYCAYGCSYDISLRIRRPVIRHSSDMTSLNFKISLCSCCERNAMLRPQRDCSYKKVTSDIPSVEARRIVCSQSASLFASFSGSSLASLRDPCRNPFPALHGPGHGGETPLVTTHVSPRTFSTTSRLLLQEKMCHEYGNCRL